MIEQRLGGRYEIKSRVGGGGMAIVYRGHDLLLDRTVAIKVLRSQYGTDEDFIRRFRREAQAAAKLTHPNVVNIYDVGQEDDTHYIVMEYVEGETLKDLIKREAPLPASKAVNITIQIAQALDHAHQNQIIHRDIKPHNILIGKNGVVKVTDFGIARAVTSATITQTGSVMGSVHYFSPEQAKGGLTGEKSDIYSLGVVLYEMVTGELPFSGESPISVALKHLQEEFRDPRELNAEIPQSLENVILKSLCKDPDHRYLSAREMEKDLETCLLSSRLNEVKFKPLQLETGDDPTIIIPAIRHDAGNTRIHTPIDNNEYSTDDDHWTDPPARKRWIKPLVWLVVIALIIGIGYYFVKQIQAMFDVPEVVVPMLENMEVDEAVALLTEKDLIPDIKQINHDLVESGYVIKQDPKEGTTIKSGTTVSLTVSLGKATSPMPDVTMKRLREAQYLLQGFGFKEKDIIVEEDYNEEVPTGSVITQLPLAQTPVVPNDTTVKLIVSKGGETFTMPSIIGMTEAQVRATLVKYGLELDQNIIEKESYFDKGLVLSQWPVQPGEQVAKGTKITIEISSGMKEDALVNLVPILIEVDKETDVEIRISDARYSDFTIIHETVSTRKPYEIEVVLSPSRNATITVFEDGIEAMTTRKTYDEVQTGGD